MWWARDRLVIIPSSEPKTEEEFFESHTQNAGKPYVCLEMNKIQTSNSDFQAERTGIGFVNNIFDVFVTKDDFIHSTG